MNNIWRNSILTLSSLKKNKLRTFLSILGISIGIMSLVVIMSAGQSLRQIFVDQLDTFGTDYVEVEIKVPNTKQNSSENAVGLAQGVSITTLSHEDKEDIDNIPNVVGSYSMITGQGSATSVYEEKRIDYLAVSSEFDFIDKVELADGRFFTTEEDNQLARVAVLGSKAAEDFFPNQDPIGQTIRIQKTRFKVIGVYQERGAVPFFDMDKMIFIPVKTAQKLLLGYDHLLAIFAQLEDVGQDEVTAEEVRAILRSNHEITDPDKDDFAVITQAEALATVNSILDAVTLVVAVIASIALVVGGVGIMNIMYVVVSERYFEIGLRKAVGATRRHIKTQFLTESILVTIIGGLAGAILAFLVIVSVYFAAKYQGFDWPLEFSASSFFIAIIFSSAVGVAFGYLPAKKAASLDPVAALSGRKN